MTSVLFPYHSKTYISACIQHREVAKNISDSLTIPEAFDILPIPSKLAAAVDDIIGCVLPALLCLTERRDKGELLDDRSDPENRTGASAVISSAAFSTTLGSVFLQMGYLLLRV